MKAHIRDLPERNLRVGRSMLVVSIVGILATMVTMKVAGAVAQERMTRARTEITHIQKAIELYLFHSDRGSESAEDLHKSVIVTGEGSMDIGLDPWGNPYLFERVGSRRFIVRSYGADGSPGGEGEDADIDSEHL